jgi:hypothetical protein
MATHCKYVSVLFTIFMKTPLVQQQSVTIPRQAGFLVFSLVAGVGILLWFHALAAVFKEAIKVNVDARSRV